MLSRLLLSVAAFSFSFSVLLADGPDDNLVDRVRRVPPPGLKVPEADRAKLEEGVASLGADLKALRGELASKPDLVRVLPDIEVFHKAVDWALRYDEFFTTNNVKSGHELLRVAHQRIQQLRGGSAPWINATGLVVRAYVSKIDGSIQPYGLVVPASHKPGKPTRLDFWFHGRGETLSELDFIAQRLRSVGEFAPADAVVLHTYGRYCNGQRFAGDSHEGRFFNAILELGRGQIDFAALMRMLAARKYRGWINHDLDTIRVSTAESWRVSMSYVETVLDPIYQ